MLLLLLTGHSTCFAYWHRKLFGDAPAGNKTRWGSGKPDPHRVHFGPCPTGHPCGLEPARGLADFLHGGKEETRGVIRITEAERRGARQPNLYFVRLLGGERLFGTGHFFQLRLQNRPTGGTNGLGAAGLGGGACMETSLTAPGVLLTGVRGTHPLRLTAPSDAVKGYSEQIRCEVSWPSHSLLAGTRFVASGL